VFDQTEWVWKDGQMVRWDLATVHVSAHALHYGSGVFEGIRCYETEEGPAVFRLGPHLRRFSASAQVYGIRIPYSEDELRDAVVECIRINNYSSCYVRPICYYGSHTLGVHPRRCPVEVAILTWPWAAYLGDDGLKTGVRITVSPWLKFDSQMVPTTAKACGQYLNSMLAVRDAVRRGYDEALLLDSDGYIAEGSGENLFVVRDGRLFTNDEQSSILMGVTRDAVILLAKDMGLEVQIGKLQLGDLLSCDEAFFTGTAAEVTPIRELDGNVIGGGGRGPITLRIQEAFFGATRGRDSRYRDWLHFVSDLPVEALV
jgi:branched-chain amino acid aminotransferase